MGHSWRDTDTGSHKGGERPQQEAGSERSERLELLVNWSQGPRLMFGKGGQGTTARQGSSWLPAKQLSMSASLETVSHPVLPALGMLPTVREGIAVCRQTEWYT